MLPLHPHSRRVRFPTAAVPRACVCVVLHYIRRILLVLNCSRRRRRRRFDVHAVDVGAR